MIGIAGYKLYYSKKWSKRNGHIYAMCNIM